MSLTLEQSSVRRLRDFILVLQERKIKAEKRKSGHEKTTLPQRQCRLEESDYDGSVALCQGIEF